MEINERAHGLFGSPFLISPQPRSQGLSSYRPVERARAGKMRDPGNEVDLGDDSVFYHVTDLLQNAIAGSI